MISGRIWEEDKKIYYDRFDNSKTLLIPLYLKENMRFKIQKQDKIYDAECEFVFYDIYQEEYIYVYKYYDFYPLTNKTDMTFFISPKKGLRGFYISHKGTDNLNRIFGIYGDIYVNNYNYENYRLGGYL